MINKMTCILILLLLALSRLAGASTISFPGNCGATLQACISGAQPGSIIQISAAQVKEDLTINKSLTLVPAPGVVAPIIGNDLVVHKIRVDEGPSGETVNVTLKQLHLVNARIEVVFDAGSMHSFLLQDSTISISQSGVNAIEFTELVESISKLYGNRIFSSGWAVYAVSGLPLSKNASFLFHGNRVTSNSPALSEGGFHFVQEGNGGTYITVTNNVIFDVTGCCSSNGAIQIDAVQNSFANLSILNNTIDDVNNGHGIKISTPLATSSLYGTVANNIVTNTDGNWLQLGATAAGFDIFEDYNTSYMAGLTGYNGHPVGANTTSGNPLYVNAANRDYRLSTFSPAANTGNGALGLAGTPDVDGELGPRILGGGLDRGALERTAGLIGSYLVLSDTFEDGMMSADYTYEKGTWAEDGKALVSTSTGGSTVWFTSAPDCDVCTISVDVRVSDPPAGSIRGGKLWVFGWFQDKNNTVELLIKEDTDKVILRQRVNGNIVAKAKAIKVIEPQKSYRFDIVYDGSTFEVYSGELYLHRIIQMDAVGAPQGGFGFQSKGANAYVEDFFVR